MKSSREGIDAMRFAVFLTGGLVAMMFDDAFIRHAAVKAFLPRSLAPGLHSRSKHLPSHILSQRNSEWDDLVDEEDDHDGEFPPTPPDMAYVPRNILRQNKNFVAIREAGGKELTNDVYVREPDSGIFWFAGKVARVSDVSLEQCVSKQYPLIAQHASNLRPMELFPHQGKLEIWTAPGDSELDVAYNRPSVVFQKHPRQIASTLVKNVLVGFQGEVYQQGEEGFRTARTDDGRPANPEVQSADSQAPTDAEMAELQERLEGQDLNALYEEQQRREGLEP